MVLKVESRRSSALRSNDELLFRGAAHFPVIVIIHDVSSPAVNSASGSVLSHTLCQYFHIVININVS